MFTPLIRFLQVLLGMVSVMFVGRLGELELASASLGISLYNATGFWIMLGLVGAMVSRSLLMFSLPTIDSEPNLYTRQDMELLFICSAVSQGWCASE
jgi:hypothetical protein